MIKEIRLPRLINNAFVKANPELIFLYGHDVQNKGCFGQSSIAGYENTFPIPTMYKFCASGARYFIDSDSVVDTALLTAIFSIPKDGRPIIPLRKLGQGCSRFAELAPIKFAILQGYLARIAYPDIKWDYTWEYGIQY